MSNGSPGLLESTPKRVWSSVRSDPILTDAEGRPLPKPQVCDYPDAVSYLEAFHAWEQRVTNLANQAFDRNFLQSMKEP